ncbi:MAG TPA: hypothetical protein VMR45_04445 [Patescibacteria group bacterium]|nr:hypothetical protein [Patescibacteria group bacterium]
MAYQNSQSPQKTPSGSGYGKRPIWQWVLLYVVVAAIVYGIVYYFYIRK